MELVYGQDEAVALWAGAQLGVAFQRPYVAIGVARGDEPCGAAVFNEHYRGGNIELTFVGRGVLNRRVQKALAEFAFLKCQASRITIRTMRRNAAARKLLGRGNRFYFEGVQRQYYGPEKGDDALVYVLFRDQADKWLEN